MNYRVNLPALTGSGSIIEKTGDAVDADDAVYGSLRRARLEVIEWADRTILQVRELRDGAAKMPDGDLPYAVGSEPEEPAKVETLKIKARK
jgi:hypothetical protein